MFKVREVQAGYSSEESFTPEDDGTILSQRRGTPTLRQYVAVETSNPGFHSAGDKNYGLPRYDAVLI
jgi:hypothetical protein